MPHALYLAAAAAEHFATGNSSYGGMGVASNHPGAYGVRCGGGWALAEISRPRVGTTDGLTLFAARAGAWQESKRLGGMGISDCILTGHGLTEQAALALLPQAEQSFYYFCDLSHQPPGFPSAQAEWIDSWGSDVPATGRAAYWARALSDLTSTAAGAPGANGSTGGARTALRTLISARPSGATTSAAASASVASLDRYFGTSRLGPGSGPQA